MEYEQKTGPGGIQWSDTGTFSAVVARTGVPDKVNDIIQPGAVSNAGTKMFLNAWGHSRQEEPYGVVSVFERGSDIVAEGKLLLDLPQGKRMHTIMQQAGDAMQFSIGYITKKASFHEVNKPPHVYRHLDDIAITEVSPVTIGAQDTRLLDVKTAPTGACSDCGSKDEEIKILGRRIEDLKHQIYTARVLMGDGK